MGGIVICRQRAKVGESIMRLTGEQTHYARAHAEVLRQFNLDTAAVGEGQLGIVLESRSPQRSGHRLRQFTLSRIGRLIGNQADARGEVWPDVACLRLKIEQHIILELIEVLRERDRFRHAIKDIVEAQVVLRVSEALFQPEIIGEVLGKIALYHPAGHELSLKGVVLLLEETRTTCYTDFKCLRCGRLLGERGSGKRQNRSHGAKEQAFCGSAGLEHIRPF